MTEAAPPPRLLDSSLTDFRSTLQAPAGQRGFLMVGQDGHFTWKDGTRARFWGINVSSTRLDIPPERIEQTVDAFARAGLNLVRLEAIDNRNCLLGSVDAPDSKHFDPKYLDRLDYWMDSLRRHGIYYYLDLLDFRTFKDGDGVLNADKLDRGARPYAVFDRYLLQLQKEYATNLLTHRNPYSGLRPVDDPALAMVEICNEHGFFLYPEKLETLVEPYRADLQTRWNRWLVERYGTREAVEAAWGFYHDYKALRPEEDPAQGSVGLPSLAPPITEETRGILPDTRPAAKRRRDGVEFLVGLQRAYFREMRDHLLSLGLRVPVTAVVSNHVVPDVASVAQECDFTSENWYGDGPSGDPSQPGLRFYGNRNPLRDDSPGGFAPFTAALRWNRKPVVIREWAVPWPNRYRAASVPEALAYAALQDYDAMLLFGYQTNRAPNGAEAGALNDFAFQSDPTVWGLYALAGRAFLSGTLRPATHTLTLRYPPARRFSWPTGLSDLHPAAYSARLQSETGEDAATNSSPRLTPTGTSADAVRLRSVLKRWNGQNGRVWRSDTGQIARFCREGRLEARAPSLRLIAGEFTPGRVYDLGGGLRFSTPTRCGALLAIALDGLPIERSRHVVFKMVSRAENTGQTLVKAPPDSISPWQLKKAGAAPVRTFGRASTTPTRLWMVTPAAKGKLASSRSLLALWMVDGTWELEIKQGARTLLCDTPGLMGKSEKVAFTTPQGLLRLAEETANSRTHSPSLR